MSAEDGGRDTGRITVSRDALRAELATLELRLVEKLATKADHDDLERRVGGLETWRAYTAGAAAVAVALATAAVSVVVAYLT